MLIKYKFIYKYTTPSTIKVSQAKRSLKTGTDDYFQLNLLTGYFMLFETYISLHTFLNVEFIS